MGFYGILLYLPECGIIGTIWCTALRIPSRFTIKTQQNNVVCRVILSNVNKVYCKYIHRSRSNMKLGWVKVKK